MATLSSAVSSSEEGSSKNEKLRVLGVCGGIGSGKSAACKLLVEELDCVAHVDADSVAHLVYRPGSQAVQEIAKEFGADRVLNDEGEIDRPKLGAIVFADRQEMMKLERIVWPHVETEIKKKISEFRQEWESGASTGKRPVVVVEAAVLLDAGWQDSFLDAVWVVSVEEEVAVQRLMNNRSLSREEALKRIHAQLSRRGIGNVDEEVKDNVVTSIIDNSGNLDDLREALKTNLHDERVWY